jgi:ribonuclease HI
MPIGELFRLVRTFIRAQCAAAGAISRMTKGHLKILSCFMKIDESAKKLTIYTDGACSPNPGPGGWGAVLLRGGKVVKELSGAEAVSTNNRMELSAAVESLRAVKAGARVVLYTDSIYLKSGITDWIKKWQANGWKTADKKVVKNSDLWQALLIQIERHQVDWRWVKGHGSNPHNIRADALAVAARKKLVRQIRPVPASSPAAGQISLFTGVTCSHKTGVGGWSVILTWHKHVKILGGRATGMSANQLYLHGLIRGLESLKKELPVQVYTHSGYLYDGSTAWIDGWKKRNWQTRDGQDVSNRDMWQTVAALLRRYQVSFSQEDKENPPCFLQEAKELAKEFAQEY